MPEYDPEEPIARFGQFLTEFAQEEEEPLAFADPPAPEPLEDEVVPAEVSPLPELPAAAQAFDLPLALPTAQEIEPLPLPEPKKGLDGEPIGTPPRSSPDEPLSLPEMLSQQQRYSEMSLRDFLAERAAEEDLPLPGRTQAPYEPFPLPERKPTQKTQEARLDAPFVPQGPSRPSETGSPLVGLPADGTTGFGFEVPFGPPEEHPDHVTRSAVRDEIAKDAQTRFLSQFE